MLEVLQILEAEVHLRDDTRVAEQARRVVKKEERVREAVKLSQTQDALKVRTEKVTDRIRELPDGKTEFAEEIGLLVSVAKVMQEGTTILAKPETGPRAIAVETDAIELLLASKRINPNGSGGAGSNPGGGGGGTTNAPAIAFLGRGINEKEVREDHGVAQATGAVEVKLPEEFRDGLDEYFNRLEKGGSKPAADKPAGDKPAGAKPDSNPGSSAK